MAGINIPVTSDTAQATAALKNISSQIDQIAKSQTGLKGSLQTIASIGGAYATVSSAISKVVSTASALVSEYAAGARQTITMQAAVKSMGTQMGITTKDVFELAGSLKQVTTYDNDTLIGVQQLLVATKSLSKDGLKQATEASLDLATAMGTDAKSAASSLARALADPADNMRALRSANIQFTNAEEDQIKTLQKSGKLWNAQQIILEKVEKTYGGMAKAVGDTDVGKLDRIAGAMGDLRESLGGALVNAISPYLDNIYDSIVRIQNWIDEHNAATSLSMDLQNGGSPCSAEGNRLGRPVHHQPLSQACRTQGSDQGRDLLRVSHPVPFDGFTPGITGVLGVGRGNLQVLGGLGIDMSGTTSLSIGVLWTW